MSLEQAMADLTAALNANTAALSGGAAVTPIKPARAKAINAALPAATATAAVAVVAAAAPAARTATVDTAAPVNAAQIKAAGDDLSVLAELDRATAIAILGEFGVQKMTAMPQSSIPEFHNKVKAALVRLQPPAAAPSLV